MSVEQNAADREARNEYLSNLDEVWEVCREAVESARDEYEDALDLSRMSYESEQAESAAEYGRAIDEAWVTYKKAVADTPSISRKDAIAEARAAYNERAAAIHESYELGAETQQEEYLQTSHDARLVYESAVEGAFEGYRTAIHKVSEFVPAPGPGGSKSSGASGGGGAAGAPRKAAAPAPAAPKVEEVVLEDITAGADDDESFLELAEALAARSGGADDKDGSKS